MSYIQNPVQIITRRIIKPNLDVSYPAVVGLSNLVVQQRINSTILALASKLIVDQGYYQNPTTQVLGQYEIKTNERGVLSLSIINYAYAYHAAHGMTYIKSLTFDLQTGKSYQLAELFKPGSDYVKVLSDMVALQIKERQLQLLEEFKGIRPDQDYYIADVALVIYFQLYEITAYVYGFPKFPISVFSIQDIVKDDSPLGRMAVSG